MRGMTAQTQPPLDRTAVATETTWAFELDDTRRPDAEHRHLPITTVQALLADPFDVAVHVFDQIDVLLDWLRTALDADRAWVVETPKAQPQPPTALRSLDDGGWRVETDQAGVDWFSVRVRSGERVLNLAACRSGDRSTCPHQLAQLAAGRLVRFAAWSASVATERAAAEIDPLTGLGNRAAADMLMASLDVGHALAVLDLDEFKRTNDLSGHIVGDQVLRSFAALLTSRTRHGDTAARLGGDEFVLVIRDGVHASDIVRRIVTDWQSSGLGTVSAGTAVRNGDDSSADVYMRADRNLYAAKRARGR